MTNTTNTPNTPATTPPKRNHKAWSRRKMVIFLRELAASQSVAQSAKAVGLSRQSPAFEALLERIEWAGFDWEEGESLPVNGGPITDRVEGERLERGFLKTSWYADIMEYRRKNGRT